MTTNTTTLVKITLNQLKGLDACKGQLKLFEDTFGKEVSFRTKAQAIKVAVKMAQKLDFDWASDNLLKGGYWKAYKEAIAPLSKAYREAKAPLSKAYEEAAAPLWKAYEEAEAPLTKAYEEAEAPLWEAYKEAEAPLWEAYQEAKAPLYKAYKEAIAKEFAKCYFDQEQKR